MTLTALMTALLVALAQAGRRLTEWAERRLPDYHERPIAEEIHERFEMPRLDYHEEAESEARR